MYFTSKPKTDLPHRKIWEINKYEIKNIASLFFCICRHAMDSGLIQPDQTSHTLPHHHLYHHHKQQQHSQQHATLPRASVIPEMSMQVSYLNFLTWAIRLVIIVDVLITTGATEWFDSFEFAKSATTAKNEKPTRESTTPSGCNCIEPRIADGHERNESLMYGLPSEASRSGCSHRVDIAVDRLVRRYEDSLLHYWWYPKFSLNKQTKI